MMNDERDTQVPKAATDDLTRLLRSADPAAETQLDPVEAARMRQAVVDAGTRTPATTWGAFAEWTKPALATAALLVVVAAGVWSMNRPADDTRAANLDPVETTTSADDTGAAGDPAIVAPAPNRDPVAEATAPASAPPSERANDEAVSPDIDTVAQPEATTVADVEPIPSDKTARTVRFTAPRGTRIIWTLDPNFESPTAGSEPRQEN